MFSLNRTKPLEKHAHKSQPTTWRSPTTTAAVQWLFVRANLGNGGGKKHTQLLNRADLFQIRSLNQFYCEN